MTRKSGDVVIVEETGDAECTDCGQIDELRPYGPEGAWVCFDCMMKDEEEGTRQFNKLFDGQRDI